MVEVFKTNVKKNKEAHRLLHVIHTTYRSYEANFDLDDCDKILRVESNHGHVKPGLLISLLRKYGYMAEVL